MAELYQTRIVCITGSLGSGKTLITHEISEPFLRDGYKFVTNFKSAWVDEPDMIEMREKGDQVHAVVVVDEGGLYVRSFEDVKRLSSFARKLDMYILFSGKKLPHVDLQELRLYLWFDLWKNLRIPLRVWRYDVQIDVTKSYHGYLWQTGWWAFYGLYSTLDPGSDAEEILKWVDSWIRRFGSFYDRKQFDGVSKVDKNAAKGDNVVELGEIRDGIETSVRRAAESISQLQRKTKR